MQLYASAGYVVFYPNFRGSTGYGEAFGNLLYNNYPGDDYQDIMDGVDQLIVAGYIDEDHLYVTGGSAGGIMTAWIIGKNHRFRAASVEPFELDQIFDGGHIRLCPPSSRPTLEN